ncbi:MAG: TlpA family protein disulfide reductase [Bryobacteraceae bacterium]
MKIHVSAAIGLALMSITAQSSKAADAPMVRAPLRAETERRAAPPFELQDAAGKSVKLSDYRGQVLLLNFWATWCGGCKREIPWFQEFHAALGPQGFSVLGVSMDQEGWAAVKPYVAKAGVGYRMVLAAKSTSEGYAVTSLPATLIIDRQGRIAATYIGLVDRADLENNLKAVLGQGHASQ